MKATEGGGTRGNYRGLLMKMKKQNDSENAAIDNPKDHWLAIES
jgi:hypothetical protein